jgi:DNA-binding transcriptional LysR family regulator
MLDLNQVFLFVEIVRAGSFAEASRRLGVPANTVSRHIRQLEAELDTRLMHRSTRKLTLTAAGQAFFERCAPSVSELSQAGQEFADGNDQPGGLVRVAAPAGFFDLFPVEWIADFLAAHPRVRMEFVLDDAKTDMVGQSIDVALRAGRLVDGNTVGRKLADTHFGLVASPAYLARRGTPAGPRDIDGHDCIPLSQRSGPVDWRLEAGDGPVDIQVTGRFRANTARAVLQAAVAGLGIALLPEPLVAADVEAGRLIRVLPAYRQESASLYAVFLSRRQIPRAVSAFVEFATQQLLSNHAFLDPARKTPLR